MRALDEVLDYLDKSEVFLVVGSHQQQIGGQAKRKEEKVEQMQQQQQHETQVGLQTIEKIGQFVEMVGHSL